MFAQTRYYDVTIHEAPHLIIPPISRNLDAQTELMKPRGQLDAKQREAEIVAASEERQQRRDYEIEQGGNSDRKSVV